MTTSEVVELLDLSKVSARAILREMTSDGVIKKLAIIGMLITSLNR